MADYKDFAFVAQVFKPLDREKIYNKLVKEFAERKLLFSTGSSREEKAVKGNEEHLLELFREPQCPFFNNMFSFTVDIGFDFLPKEEVMDFCKIYSFDASLRARGEKEAEEKILMRWVDFVELSKMLIKILGPKIDFGWGDNEGAQQAIFEGEPFIIPEERPTIFTKQLWFMFYGSERLKKIGKSAVMKAPAWKVESFSDGVLLLNGPAPSSAVPGIPDTTRGVSNYFEKILQGSGRK
ncbi:MAG: hypothetical protein HY393_00305 [Candidatus Diapherotrites archaeon]|nr:hypothetical protein [Candidatus Diapherotrites archaeon]